MPLVVSNDNLAAKEITLSGIVELCKDCVRYCREKTERVVSNRSRAPKGWESEYQAVAESRRKEDMDTCVDACKIIPRSCPSVERLRLLEKTQETTAANASKTSTAGLLSRWTGSDKKKDGAPHQQALDALDVPTIHELSRCEHAAERFVGILFAISQKPSKIHFDNVNPKTGEKMSDGDADTGGSEALNVAQQMEANSKLQLSAPGKKPAADSKVVNEEIMRRWSAARRERLNMEGLGIIRSTEDANALKQQITREEQQQKAAEAQASGTVPKWK